MGATGSYLRKITGFWLSRECCPASGMATRSGDKYDSEKFSQLLPPSAKLTVDVTSADYTVPEEVRNYVKGISVNTSGLVSMKLANDETTDTVYLTAGQFFPCQVLTVYTTNTATKTGIRIYY